MYATKRKIIGMIAAIVALALTTILFVTLMSVFVVQRDEYRTQLENVYQKTYYELVSNVNNLEVKLSKLMVTSGLSQKQALLADISRQADEAEYNLSEIPVRHSSIAAVNSFVNQLNGYSSYLLKRLNRGEELDAEQQGNIETLHRASKLVANELLSLTEMIGNGFLFTDGRVGQQVENPLGDMFDGLQQGSLDYPELIYDGPFSEARADKELRGLSEEGDITEEQGAELVKKYLKVSNANAECACSSRNIEAYCYTAKDGEGKTYYVQLTKKGGRPLLVSASFAPAAGILTQEEAAAQAESLALHLGFPKMKAVWYSGGGSYATVNLAPVEGGVILYPDLVKIKISLEDGSLLGLEAQNYYYNHTDRSIAPPSASAEPVKREISKKLTLIGERLAVVPVGEGGETLAWEISASYDGLQYFIYVDAVTGGEIDVFRVVDTEQGQLLI